MKQLHNAECLLGTGSDGTRYTPAVSYHNPIARDRFTTQSATEDKFAREVDKLRVLTCFLRCRCDAGLALAVQRYAREHGISVALTMRMALISWCDRTGYLRAAQKAVQRNSDAAMKELRRLYRT